MATAAPTFASLLWLSDSEAAAQLGVVAGLLLALRLERTGERRLGVALLLVGVAAWKCKASGKALPLVLLGWLAVARPAGWRRVLPWALGLLALSVPWLALPSDPVPPVLAGPPADDFHWRATNLDGWARMLWGNGRLLPGGTSLPYGLASLVLPFGPLALLGARRPGPAASSGWGLLLPWLGVQVAVMGSYPDIPGPLLGRYLLAASLPLAVAFGLAFAHRPRLLVLPLLLQIGLGVHDTSVRKRTQGCTIVAADRARAWIEQAPTPQTVVLLDVPHTGGPKLSPHTFVVAPAGSPEANRLLQGDVLAISRRPLPPPWRRAQSFDARAGWVSIQGPRLASCTCTVWTKRR